MDPQAITREVQKRYAEKAKRAGSGCCGDEGPVCSDLYAPDQIRHLPEGAVFASCGCGDPVTSAELRAGETVLDLGSGGGIDVLLAARHVGPSGKVYGLDMTDEMLRLAEENTRRTGVTNVEFLKWAMEAIPLPDRSVDVILSNCVVNLSPAKERVFAEAFRVLRPGGRLAIADVILRGAVPPIFRRSVELWAGCVAGALEERGYIHELETAGFQDVEITLVRTYALEQFGDSDAGRLLAKLNRDEREQIVNCLASALVRARKPRS